MLIIDTKGWLSGGHKDFMIKVIGNKFQKIFSKLSTIRNRIRLSKQKHFQNYMNAVEFQWFFMVNC